MCVQHVPTANKPSTEVNKRTIQRRTKYLKEQMSEISAGPSDVQLGHLISTASRKSLQQLLEKLQMKTRIPALNEMALKADLGLSWAGLKLPQPVQQGGTL